MKNILLRLFTVIIGTALCISCSEDQDINANTTKKLLLLKEQKVKFQETE